MLTIVHDYSDFCGSNFLTVGMVSARQRLKFEADQRPVDQLLPNPLHLIYTYIYIYLYMYMYVYMYICIYIDI